MRGTKESIKLLMPILVSFFVAHVIIIAVGIGMHGADLPSMVTATVAETHGAFHNLGFLVVIGLFMRAYSLGASTYTGIEAVSNNVNILAEPKVRTGRLTMLYMASSLSITAGGIILLYLLWQVKFIPGMTLNASVFTQILGTSAFGHLSLILLLALEAGVLFIAANTGFLGGPAVMANMSLEEWVPKRFRWLSSQLVKQKGILFFDVAALIILLISGGSVDLLTVLYSINVFITFSLTLFGMSRYFWRHRDKHSNWFGSWSLSVVAFIICVVILCVGIITKFDLGGWLTLLVTFVGILICWGIRYQYRQYKRQRDNYNKKHLPKDMLASLQNLAQSEKIPSETFSCFGADTTEDLVTLIEQVQTKYPNSVYFATRYIYPKTNPLERALRSNISTILQRRLQLLGLKVLTVPLLLK